MTQNLSLPVVFLHDTVVLPGMVVPIELDDQARAAIDAARLAHDSQPDGEPTRVLVAPRLEDRYATHGVVAVVDKVGRFAGGKPAAVLRAERRVAIGAGVTGPGAALWVEAETVPETPDTDELRALADDYRALVVSILERREAWQVIETVRQVDDPGRAGRHVRLRAVPLRRPEATGARDPRRRRPAAAARRLDAGVRRRGRGQRQDQPGRARGAGEEPARVPAAPAARGDPQGARRG